jgi:hypothetical protein
MEIKINQILGNKTDKNSESFLSEINKFKKQIFFIENQRQKLYLIKDRSKAHSLHNNH